MSHGRRIPREEARLIADRITERFSLPASPLELVGSLRRDRPDVGDIEFIAPVPTAGDRDGLWERLESKCSTVRSSSLFASVAMGASGRIGVVASGGGPLFRQVSLEVEPELLGLTPAGTVKVEIYRYDAGEFGNRGWIELMRTGPADFGRWVLTQLKKQTCGQGRSEKGYLRPDGRTATATPTEAAVFAMIQSPFIVPERRDEFVRRCIEMGTLAKREV